MPEGVLSEEGPRAGSAEFYRARARENLEQAEKATSEEARISFLMLAEHWQRLAQTTENPGW